MQRILLVIIALTMSLPAQAQLGAPVKNGETSIIVTGTKPRDSRDARVPMSDWRMAETPHVVVFSQGDEKALRTTAENLETLHFLLSALFGRVDAPDETIKVAVTMIGDIATFEHLRLTDLRWQYGPFPEAFAKSIYYDPRDEGSVLASTEDGVNLILQPSRGRPTNRNCIGGEDGPPLDNFIVVRPDPAGLANGSLSPDVFDIIQQLPMNEIAVCQSAESRLYAGFAQNYLMTYFPAAYPRWFLQGFGEMFATMAAGDDFVEYGQLPTGFTKVMDFYGDYPVSHILDGRYLTSKRAWTPYHAWRIVHFLYFSEEWKPRLQAYLAALARGDDLASAAQALGDPTELQRAVARYRGRKVQGERMTFPAERVAEASIRRLTRAEAGLIRGRLELGARIELPADDGRDRTKALNRQSDWLDRLRDNATRFPDLIEHQLLLAEAECRAGNSAECLAAADRALAQSPSDTRALVWKGTAMTQLAARTPGAEGRRQAAAGRRLIVRANRLDPESSLPLIAYHDSFAAVGEPASDAAVEGLIKVVGASPAAPTTRLKLGEAFVRRELDLEARKTLLPVAKGPFESPEQPAAAALLPKPGAAGGG